MHEQASLDLGSLRCEPREFSQSFDLAERRGDSSHSTMGITSEPVGLRSGRDFLLLLLIDHRLVVFVPSVRRVQIFDLGHRLVIEQEPFGFPVRERGQTSFELR